MGEDLGKNLGHMDQPPGAYILIEAQERGETVRRQRRPGTRGRLAGRMAAVLSLVGLAVLSPTLAPLAEELLGRAALVSAALTMPQGAAVTLRERYAPEIYAPDGLSPEGKAPPPPAPETSSSQSQSPGSGPDSSGWGSTSQSPTPEIEKEFQGQLREVFFEGEDTPAFYHHDGGWIRNYTKLDAAQLKKVLSEPIQSIKQGEKPQILIYHTHTTESYEEYDSPIYDVRNTWRSTDNNNNMAAVGEALKEALEAEGWVVLHDTTQHDYPSYNGSYERSRKTVQQYLKEYPSIQVLLDVHRDAILYDDDSVAKPVVEIDGRKAAQVMVVSSCDDGSVGVPGWRDNLRFAAALGAEARRQVPGLFRPTFFAYRHYNQDLAPRSLLLEFGSNGNTLEEALYSAQLLGPILGAVLAGR